MSECVFCNVLSGNIPSHKIWEDDDYLAFLDINPINPGHTLLIPKVHEDYIFDLGTNELGALFSRAKLISEPLKQANKAKRIGIMVEGFAVPHIHVHLIPIHSGHDLDPKRAQPATEHELTAMADKIRKVFDAHE